MKPLPYLLAGALLALSLPAAAELRGYVAAEGRGFLQDPRDNAQPDAQLSLVIEPEWIHDWDDGRQSFSFKPFARLDSADDERSHLDLREALWIYAGDGWEMRAGVGKVFWGVTESQHLVDVINQTDLLENPDGEQKLGQPLLKLSLERDWGTLDLFALPYFRERTFPGRDGRLRTHPRIDADQARYASSDEQQHVDVALRWSHYIGDYDFAISHFRGTSRDPQLLPGTDNGQPVLLPFYAQMRQTGIELQATKGDWLWKFEGIRRSSSGDSYYALTGGFEYTLYGIADSDADLGLLAEYLFDDRHDSASTPFQDDLFLGLRWTANDADGSELLGGVVMDRQSSARFFNIEGSRRIGEHWKLTLQGRFWSSIPASDPAWHFAQDDYIETGLAYYF